MGWKLEQALNEKQKLLEGSWLSSPPERAACHRIPEKATAAQHLTGLVLFGSPIKHNRTMCLFKDAGPGVLRQRTSSGRLVPSLRQAKQRLFGNGLHQEPFEVAENMDKIQCEIGSGHSAGAKHIP